MRNYWKILICILFIALLSVVLTGCACDHVESDWIVDAEATYDSDGSKHVECTECGEILKTETIPEITLWESLADCCLYQRVMEWAFFKIGDVVEAFERLDSELPFDNGLSYEDVTDSEIVWKDEDSVIIHLLCKRDEYANIVKVITVEG